MGPKALFFYLLTEGWEPPKVMDTTRQLKRHFRPLALLLISINGMVGSAWLFGPYYSAQSAGPASLIAWLIGSIAVIFIAFTFAELSVLFPIAGGVAQIPQISHGTSTSFIISWIAWLSCVTMPAIETQAILQYSSIYFPKLTHPVGQQHILTGFGMLWAVLIMVLLSWINIANVKNLIKTNFVVTAFKLSIIAILLAALFFSHFDIHNFFSAQYGGFSPNGLHGIMSAVTVGGIAFAFTGFRHGVELAAEAKNPNRALPLAIIGSVICCLFLYLLLQIAFIGAQSAHSLNHGWHGLHFSGDAGPFVGMASLLGLTWLVTLIYSNAIVAPFGTGLIYVTSTARIVYGMSKNNYFPKFFTHLNKHHTPVNCIILNCIVELFLFLPLPGWQSMVSFLVSSVVISYGMGPIALLALRLQLPHAKRSFKLPFSKLIANIAFYMCNLIAFWSGWDTIKKLSIALLIGVIFFTVRQLLSKNKIKLNIASSLWILPYFTGLAIISYLGSFGGGLGIIRFGWDFALIAIFSVAILQLAVKSRLHLNNMEFDEESALNLESTATDSA